MKLLLFIETGGPGGAERVVLELARGFLSRGIETHVLTFRTGWLTDRLKDEKINHSQLETNRRLDIGLPFRISSFIQEQGITVVHSHLLDSNFYGAMAAALAGVVHVGTEHGDVHHTQGKKLLHSKLRLISWCGSRLTAVSEFSRKHLLELGFPSSKLSVVGNPLSDTAESSTTSRKDMRTELSIPPHEWVWAHVANLRPVKDQRTLLRGFAESLRHAPDQTLLLIGDGPERPALEALATELGLGIKLKFCGFREDVASYLGTSDGFILSSLSEALPMSLLEAAQSGLVLIASSVGGIPEVIRDGETGFLFPAGDSNALGALMTKVVSAPNEARESANRARREVLEKFSLDRVLNQYLALYQSNT